MDMYRKLSIQFPNPENPRVSLASGIFEKV